MPQSPDSSISTSFSALHSDVRAGIVFLVALPLCLGIAASAACRTRRPRAGT
ncbi:hypothetical protein [Trinickia acidisoli]|uniref:hypothetical protein n=1 Tax=Trinickia acidisoli TaxID=2767482 RepID=UPI001A8EF77E|nr:hypothetical protein [Trinickia acidisoli]